MEKLLQRSILNRNQLVNKKRREIAKDLRSTWRQYNRIKNLQATEIQHMLKAERVARRQDWMLGPLAPKRDVGENKKTFGSVDTLLAQAAQLPTQESRWPRGKGSDATGSEDRRMPGFEDGEWRGVGLRGNLVVGDRVVVVKGGLGVKGKIGVVNRIEKDKDVVYIRDVNKVTLRVPAPGVVSSGRHTFEGELPIHIDDVRLVAQLHDETTGTIKDVIVREVIGGPGYIQRADGSELPRHTRYIKGMPGTTGDGRGVEIPWPKEELTRFFTQSCDTTRDAVEAITYTPTVYDWAPDGVIDELRNKHARTRRDFDDLDLMRRKLLEDARRDWFRERSRVLSQPFWTTGYLLREKRVKEQEMQRQREEL